MTRTSPSQHRRRLLSQLTLGLSAAAVLFAGSLVAVPASAGPATPAAPILAGGGLHPVGAAFSPDGTTAYVADQGGFLRTYSGLSDSFVSEIVVAGAPPASNCSLSDVAVASNGANLYAPGWNCTGTAKLLKFTTGSTEQPQQFELTDGNTVTASVTGAVAVTPDDTRVLVWAETNQTPSRSGLFVLTVKSNARTLIDLGSEPSSGQTPSAIAVSPDSATAWVANGKGSVTRVDLGTGTVSSQVPLSGIARGLAVTSDGSTLYAVSEDGSVVSIDTTTNTVTPVIAIPGSSLGAVDVTSAGDKLVVAGSGGETSSTSTSWIISTATGQVVDSFAIGSDPWDVAINPEGTKAYVPNWGSGSTSVVPLADRAPVLGKDVAGTTATVGKAYSAQFAASGYPVPTFSFTGKLPTGLKLNATTGLLSGKPTAGGTFTFQIVASNGTQPDAIGASHTIAVSRVFAAKTPTINGTKKVGKTLRANSASWAGAPVAYTYQWYRATKGKWTRISKATKASYTLAKADKKHQVRVALTGSKPGFVTATKTSRAYTIT